MKKLQILFFLFITNIACLAQNVISGKITDSEGKNIPNANVTIQEAGNSSIIAYGISNAQGEYKITFESEKTELTIKVSAFNLKSQSQEIKNVTQKLDFELFHHATEIKEVQIKTKLITKKGDTISYDLKSFENKNDRVLADVLKKMPGIEVNKDGTVLYQGEPINKFYVNGKDLMEGGYGTINNSLPKDAVSKVEVMENHQPVKILKDKIISENAAINIKLKKAITMTGRGELGIGFSPLLWNAKLTPMFFTEKQQWLVNYKANNTGESVENEGKTLAFGNRFEGRRTNTQQTKWLFTETASTPNIPEKRYLMNNVHNFSANLLTNINKDWELKTIVSYTNNAIERESVYEVESSLGNHYISKTNNDFYTNQAKGEVIFSKNAKKGFFKNTTTWEGFWNHDAASTIRNTKASDQKLNSPTGSFKNSLSTIIPYKEKLINLMSYISYKKDKQNLSVTPANYSSSIFPSAILFDRLEQSADFENTEVSNSASVGFSYKNWTFTPELGLNLSFNSLDSQLYGFDQDSKIRLGNNYKNDISWNELSPYTQLGINYKGPNLMLNLNIPVNSYSVDYKDYVRNNDKEIQKTAFEPSLFVNYNFLSFWKIMTFANIKTTYGGLGSIYGGYILTNPAKLSIKDSSIPKNDSKNIGGRLEYRNPLNNLFLNIRYNYNITDRNLISSITEKPNGEIIEELSEENNSPFSQSEAIEVGKYFPKLKTNFSTSFSYKYSKSFTKKNGVLYEIKNNEQSLNLKFNNTYFSWLSIDYAASFSWSESKNHIRTNDSFNWNNNLKTYIYPHENHSFGFIWDDNTSDFSGKSYRNSFFDVSYQFTWKKKNIDFEFKCLNIADKKVYEVISYNGLDTTKSSINIRPRQFVFAAKFNFK